MGRNHLCVAALAAAVLFAGPAAASDEVGAGGGFVSGALHPILGFDHLLAMIAVGLLSVQMGGRAIWYVPAAFVAIMALGGFLGLQGVALPQVEGAIALSVFAIGLAIAMGAQPAVWLAMLFVGFFAIFHGHAHGAEIPRLAAPGAYVGGFLLATAGLHLTGVALGELCRLFSRPAQSRALLGAGSAGIGLHMLLLSYAVV